MKRWHLFEFNDAPWMPLALKALVTDYLAALTEWVQPFSAQLPLMAQALRRADKDAGVVDLCSGGGGPWRHLGAQLNRLAGRKVPVLLTDLYPAQHTAALTDDGSEVTWYPTAVDALAMPGSLRGMRTLFNGFHHFTPAAATDILRDAVANNEPIVVMELLRRNYEGVLAALFAPLLVWGLTPWVRPFSWARLLLTYVVPIAPLIIWWDTFVSVLRCYTPRELRAMGREAAGERYVWFAGNYRSGLTPVTFLIGYPRDDGDDDDGDGGSDA